MHCAVIVQRYNTYTDSRFRKQNLYKYYTIITTNSLPISIN
jgi:hypothetical protein